MLYNMFIPWPSFDPGPELLTEGESLRDHPGRSGATGGLMR